jgi:putative PEP-CTERM system TPR-repeat lipoprotein
LGLSQVVTQPLIGEALLLMGEYQRVLSEIQPREQLSATNLARILQLRANALLNLGNVEDACKLFNQSLENNKDNPEIYWGLARCAIAEQDLVKAREWLDIALKIDNKNSKSWAHLGSLELRNDNVESALVSYSNAVNFNSNNLDALAQRIKIRLYMGEVDAARKDLDLLFKVAPNSVLARYHKGLISFHQAKFTEAREALQQVLKLADNHMPSILLAGATELALGNHQQAKTYLNRVLARFPNNAEARRLLAAVQIKQGNTRASLQTLAPLLSPETEDAHALALAGEASLLANDYDKAMSYLGRAAALDPENPHIKTRLAEGLLGGGESERALLVLEQAANSSTTSNQAGFSLVILHLQRKEYDQALKAIDALEKKLPSNPVTHNLRAAALLSKKDRPGARKALEEALAIQPTFFPAAANLAALDMADNNPRAARARFDAILKTDKNNVQALMSMADIAELAKNPQEAVDWLAKAAKADPRAVAPRARLVHFHLANKDNKRALEIANETASANPDSKEALDLLGATQFAVGNLEGAIATYAKVAKAAPQSADAKLNLGMAYKAADRVTDARAALKSALELKPDHIKAYDVLMQMDLAEGRADDALQTARKMQGNLPVSPIGFDREGDIHFIRKQYERATQAYEQALAKGAGTMTLVKIHRTLKAGGDNAKAEQRLIAWLKQYPTDLTAKTYFAEQLMAARRNREAIAQYEALLKRVPENAGMLNNLALLYHSEKDNRARATAERALKLAPNHASLQDTLGWILVEQGELARGLELLRKARGTSAPSPTMQYHLGVALARFGDKAGAKKELEQALKSGKSFPEAESAKALLQNL